MTPPQSGGYVASDFWRNGLEIGNEQAFIVSLVAGATLLLAAGCASTGESGSAAGPASGPPQGSGQGGYLGSNAGSALQPAKPPGNDMKASPTAWCRAASVEPGRCMSRAAPDHAYCMEHNPDHYETCRRNMDFIGWHN
ncbi:MAG: hypothetical protein WDO24_28695 [Pseudomonadota bacterium]